MRRTYLLLLIPSIAMLFLPYTSGVSPWAAVSGSDLWDWKANYALLGVPFFLSVPILIAQTRRLFHRTFSKGERAAYLLLAYGALAAGTAWLGLVFYQGGFSGETVLLTLDWGIPCAAALWIMIRSARRLNPEEAATSSMQAAWLPNAIVCGMTFWVKGFFTTGWEIGAYLAAFTAICYLAEITLSLHGRRDALSGST
jgi:hypothetical protein